MTIYEQAVQGQLDSYNALDLESFLEWYDEAVIAYDLDTNTTLFTGKSEMRIRYKSRFENAHLHCKLLNRMVLHKTIIDHEYIIWNKENKDPYEAIAIYDVGENGLIKTIRFTKGKIQT